MSNNIQQRSPNASAVDFGWDFQHNAGIMIMLMNIKDARSIRIEGASEDIEITLNNGHKIYAQAKSVTRYDDFSNVLANIKKSIGTLNNAWQNGDGECLIYTTNSPNPLNDRMSMMAFSSAPACISYDELPTQACKGKIDKIYSQKRCSFPKEKFRIFVFGFHGNEDDNRYRNVENWVGRFMESVELHGSFYWGKRAMERWQVLFGRNATKTDRRIEISKETMMWPLIVWLCDAHETDVWSSNVDEGAREEINRHYQRVIRDAKEDFRFVTKVLSLFDEYKALHENRNKGLKDVVQAFVSNRWGEFLLDFDLRGADDEITEAVISLAVENVIRNRFAIKRIKAEVNL